MKRKKNWKLFWLSCASLAFLPFLKQAADACIGGWEDWENYDQSMYNQENGCENYYLPFYYSTSSAFYAEGPAEDHGKIYRDAGVEEWRAYMKNTPPAADVDSLVYGASVEMLEELAFSAEQKKTVKNPRLKKNQAADFLISTRDAAAAAYLVYARRCEAQAMTGAYDSWMQPSRDTAEMLRLIGEGQRQLAKAKSSFLRERYAFQLVRLSRYAGKPADAVRYCDQYFSIEKSGSTVSRRALSAKGGALKELKRYEEARYTFAMLFDKYYPGDDWGIYALSYRFCSGIGGQVSDYRFCRNDHERVVMIALDNMMESASPGEAIEQLYRMEPGSKYLDVLLVREMKQIADGGSVYWRGKEITPAAMQTRRRVLDALRGGGLHCPQLWEFSAGYLAYLENDFDEAERWYAKAEHTAPNDSMLRDEVKIMRVVQDVQELKGISKPQETNLFAQLKTLEQVQPKLTKNAQAGFRKIMAQLQELYAKQGDKAKATICRSLSGEGYYDATNTDSRNYPMTEMMAFLERADKSPFENRLAELYAVTLPDLYEQKGRDALAQKKFKTAAQWFVKGRNSKLPGDPFVIHVVDCHDCDYADPNKTEYTRESFAKKMAQLEIQANISGPRQAEYCFQFANGLYNMTYYGNSWFALEESRNHGNYVTTDEDVITEAHMDCRDALFYYEKAMQLTKSREEAARYCFMAAKCEQNLYYIGNDYDELRLIPEQPRYFTKMKADYSNTLFYREAIRECTYFSGFTRK